MKRLFYTLIILFPSLLFIGGCERDLMNFEGEDSIYFDVRRGVSWIDPDLWSRYYFTEVNFINEPQDTVEVKLNVALSGQLKDYPRPFIVEVVKDSTTAVEGVDFNFEKDWILPANAPMEDISIYVYNRHNLLDTNIIIVLQVKENMHFTTDLTFVGDLAGRYALHDDDKRYNPDPRFHTVVLKLEASRPAGWKGMDYPNTPTEAGLFGAYTPTKYLLMLDVLGFAPEDFEVIPSNKATAMGEIFAKYLEEQFDNGTPVLEKDGRLMWVSAVKKWRPYQYTW